jgi:antitoxin MazE
VLCPFLLIENKRKLKITKKKTLTSSFNSVIIQNIIQQAIAMDIQLKKWGNSLGLRIPHQLTKNFGWDENSTLEIEEMQDALIIRKKTNSLTLEQLLASIPADFTYPDDVQNFTHSAAIGQEIL